MLMIGSPDRGIRPLYISNFPEKSPYKGSESTLSAGLRELAQASSKVNTTKGFMVILIIWILWGWEGGNRKSGNYYWEGKAGLIVLDKYF
jgi:hypothetical protein